MATVTRSLTAFLDGPDSPDISNPIHSTAVARDYGFRGALVGGVSVYGWCARPIIDVLGREWLDHGWAEVHFRRPVYPGDAVRIDVELSMDGSASLLLSNGDGEVCIRGAVGLGAAPFLGDLGQPVRIESVPQADRRTPLTMETAPVDQDLPPMALRYDESTARDYLREKQRDDGAPWLGDDARIHPGWLAARMTPLLHHTYDYAPAIHTSSLIQHVAPARVPADVVVAGHFREAFERKGHHYGVVDGLILANGDPVARIRHTTIFRVARRD
jgi:hypothetical protein